MLGVCDVPTHYTLYAHIICEMREIVKWSLSSQYREVTRNGRKQASRQWEAVLEFWREKDLGIGLWVVTEMGVQPCAISPGSRKLWEEHGLKTVSWLLLQLFGEWREAPCLWASYIYFWPCCVWDIIGYLCGGWAGGSWVCRMELQSPLSGLGAMVEH